MGLDGANGDDQRRSVIVCLDKFRGSLNAGDACLAVASGLAAVEPELPISVRPVADGGEGTVEAMVNAGYKPVTVLVTGPDGQPVQATLAIRGTRAVVELAQAAGLDLSKKDAVAASTYGVGELMVAALDAGAKEIVLALGGSATTDGGAGMLQALGARFRDADGQELRNRGGGELARLASVDFSGIDPRLSHTKLVAAADVENPLLGTDGAAAVFGPQKGANPADIVYLEAGLTRFAEVMEAQLGVSARELPGAGAAGGTGFAALCLGARFQSGMRFILDQTGISTEIHSAGLVLVGEGSLDKQSLRGKAPIAIARFAQSRGIPTVAVVGQIHMEPAAMAEVGIIAAYALMEDAVDERDAMRRAPELLRSIGMRVAQHHLRLRSPALEADTAGES